MIKLNKKIEKEDIKDLIKWYLRSCTKCNDRLNEIISGKHAFIVPLVLIFLIFLVILVYAWNCDDAYHAFIMARNLVDGNGFVYNIGERVNASTCPFHTLIVALVYYITGNMYLTGIGVCTVFAVAAVTLLMMQIRRSPLGMLFAAAVLCGCYGFIAFSTSGLENSMLFFLAAVFLTLYFSKRNDGRIGLKNLYLMALMVGITGGTRTDAVLIFIPACIAVFFFGMSTDKKWWQRYLLGFAGLLPFIAWTLFSCFYYGFPFPNTAYCKLNTHMPVSDYISRGINYFTTTYLYDNVLVLTILLYIVLSFISRNKKHITMASGVLIYIMYVFRIGGDFMVSRHYTLSFFISVFGIALLCRDYYHEKITSVLKYLDGYLKKRLSMDDERVCPSVGAVAFFILLVFMAAGIRNPYGTTTARAVDEREYYFKYTSLLTYIREGEEPIKKKWTIYYGAYNIIKDTEGAKGGRLDFAPGIMLYYDGYDLNLFDDIGLGDALITRMPVRYNPSWRIGHMRRVIPEGYNETVMYGKNMIKDPDLAEYYDKLHFVIAGDLWSKERIQTAVDINLRKYDYLIESYIRNNPEEQ